MKNLTFAFVALLVVVFASCSDNGAGPGATERMVFYPTAAIDGAGADLQGMFSVTESGVLTRIIPGSAIYVSNVAEGGVVLSEIQDSAGYRLIARCNTGALVDVPQPAPADVNRVITLNIPPRIALAFDAHFAAYPVMNGPRIPTRDGSQFRLSIVRASCAEKTAAAIDLHDSVVASMKSLFVTAARAWGNQILIDRTGTKIWMAVVGVRFPADFEEAVAYQIFEWNNGTILPVTTVSTSPYSLCAYDHGSDCIVYEHEGKLFTLAAGGKEKASTLAAGSIISSTQLAVTKSRAVVFGSSAIELRNPVDGSLIGNVLNYNHLALAGYETKSTGRSVAISPDGDAIVFALPKTGSTNRRGIFMAHSDGSFVRLLVADVACGAPVISNENSR